jgi:simple sugar transport system ATP-binding protein
LEGAQAKDTLLRTFIITHNVYHVYAVATRFVVLDKGVKIGEYTKDCCSAEELMEIIAKGAE